MARILLDQNVPHGLRDLLQGHEVSTAVRIGWEQLRNGDLISAAERHGFDIMITGDKRLRYQQDLTSRRLGVVVLSTTRRMLLKARADLVLRAVDDCTVCGFAEIEIG